MARLESIPWLLSSLVIACQSSPTFVSAVELDSALIIAALPLSGDRFDLDHARLFLPGDSQRSSGQLVLDARDPLILVAIDEPALARGLSAIPLLDPARMSLHPSSGLDCGLKGQEREVNADGTTQMRQALDRFGAAIYALSADSRGLETPEPSVGALLSTVEIELPVDAEPCRERITVAIEPLGTSQIFGGGVTVDGFTFPPSALTKFGGVHPASGDRMFLLSRTAMFAVRRAQSFDETTDDALLLRSLMLPSSGNETWFFDGSRVEARGAPGMYRVVAFVVRATIEAGRTGWAVLEIDYDGTSFSSPNLRMLIDEVGVSYFSSSEAEGSLIAGAEGRWTIIPPGNAPIETGTLGRGDIESTAFSGHPDAPHVLGIRGGFIGLGNLRDTERFAVHQVRSESGAVHLRIVMRGSEPWLYSAWKDGKVLRQPLAAADQSETLPVELPRRLATCGTVEIDPCGRGQPTKRALGLEVTGTAGPEDLVLLTHEDCSTLILHDVASGCTTGLELPLPETAIGSAVWLHHNDEGLWATTESSWSEIYRIQVQTSE